MWQSISDKLQDQIWYQQGKAKWDELDSNTRTAIKYGTLGITVVGTLALVVTSAVTVSGKKSDLDDRLGLVQKIQSAQEELRKLKEVTSSAGVSAADEPWQGYFEAQAAASGLDTATMKITGEKRLSAPAPKKGEKKEESRMNEVLVDLSLTKVNLRQLVKFVFNVENGGRTAKVRKLEINTQPDESGYLDVTLAVSGFSLKGGE